MARSRAGALALLLACGGPLAPAGCGAPALPPASASPPASALASGAPPEPAPEGPDLASGAPDLASGEPPELALAGPAGSAAPPDPPLAPAGPRIGSLRHITWIYDQPTRSGRQIGYLREGVSVRLAAADPEPGPGCPGGWYRVSPSGYVCRDGTVTLDLEQPLFRALAEAAPGPQQPLRYAFSLGAPMYRRLPTPEERRRVEGPPERWVKPGKLGQFLSGHEELAVDEVIPAATGASGARPAFLGEDGRALGVHPGVVPLVRKWIPHGSMLSFTRAFEAGGRTWLLSPDLSLVPADRLKPFRPSTFHGVELGDKIKLPLAWSRHDEVRKFRRTAEGFVAAAESWPPRTPIPLAGERVEDGPRAFLPTAEPGVFALESDVVVARARAALPANVVEGQRWLDIHIRTGTLVAYVGETPVYSTLVSPGAGGVAPYNASNAQLVKLSATPLGVYRITWKTRAAMMTPEEGGDPQKFWIADVPDTQYFRPPFAIHTAYWHEDFGMPKSAGCINVSPGDGRFLYTWTDLPTHPDWQGSGPGKGTGPGTLLVISP
jgi:hypothetical protein